ncbi:MAG: ABC transporter ATP-binding protein [Fibromonadales bacterium]|nr:ABC transporter ATP-binding protein [Fibromonadales bacterium]
MASGKWLAASGLSIGYRKPIAQNLSFELQSGLTCLIGPNGSGKSTLLKTIAGLIKPLSGTLPAFDAKTIAFVPANFPAETNIRVFDFIALGRSPHTNAFGKLEQKDIDKINSAMEQTETAHFAKFRVSSLSDGEKQRVALARALAQDTKILLMDEPTAFLDYSHRIRLFEFLKKKAKEENIAVLLSTHELNFAEQYADRILEFKSGLISYSIPS